MDAPDIVLDDISSGDVPAMIRHEFRVVQNGPNNVTLVARSNSEPEEINILTISEKGITVHGGNALLGLPADRHGWYRGIPVIYD
jgi:hypothetical protein